MIDPHQFVSLCRRRLISSTKLEEDNGYERLPRLGLANCLVSGEQDIVSNRFVKDVGADMRAACSRGISLNGVFDTKPNSGYKDELTRQYQFPSQYRRAVEPLVGDWIVYRAPQRNGGLRAYIAVARVLRIDLDPVSGIFSMP